MNKQSGTMAKDINRSKRRSVVEAPAPPSVSEDATASPKPRQNSLQIPPNSTGFPSDTKGVSQDKANLHLQQK